MDVCLSFTKQVNYKLRTFAIAEQYIRLKQENFSNELTRQITQEDTNLLVIKTTAARCSQEAVMTSHVRK